MLLLRVLLSDTFLRLENIPMPDLLEGFHAVMNMAIPKILTKFRENPRQFHGDTGIMHYLYHQVLTLGKEIVFCQQRRTLLFQSEHHTRLLYLQRGASESRGRFDFALVDPAQIPNNGDLQNAPALAAVEVGRNKDLSSMGDLSADELAQRVRPGDASKLTREMKYRGLLSAYLIELYDDPLRAQLATRLFDTVERDADDAGLIGFHMIVGVRSADPTLRVGVYPASWRAELRIEHPVLEPMAVPEAQQPARGFHKFVAACGPTNQLLQQRISQDLPDGNHVWGPNTMTVSRRRGTNEARFARITHRISAREHERPGEEIMPPWLRSNAPPRPGEPQLWDSFADELRKRGIPINDGQSVQIPPEDRCNEPFVESVMAALKCAGEVQ